MTLFFSSLDQTLDKVRHSTYLIQYGSEVWIFQILGHSADEDITIRVKQSIGNLHSLIPYIIFFAHFDQNFKELQLVFITTLIFLKVKLISKSRQTQISNLFPHHHLNSDFSTRKYIKYSKFGRILTDHLVEQISYISED